MPLQTLQLEQFLTRLTRNPSTTFTWLIGSGVSQSAGIPTAKDINSRIILLEYLCDKQMKPRSFDTLSYNLKDLRAFLQWFGERDQPDNEQFQTLKAESLLWLQTKEDFVGLSPSSAECYQQLFNKCLTMTEAEHAFLTALIGLSKGLNIFHVGLAGLLRDYSGSSFYRCWGHTVFTTNFDDLLLSAIFSLNGTARVYGDLNSADRPAISPTFPQIVHLHGRHTGYNMKNTRERISIVNSDMQHALSEHLNNSSLIVIGYSGWDDLAMTTLSKSTNIERQIFWVPYQDESTITGPARNFLESCPPGKAYVITDERNSLDADAFMIALCDTINKENGGFTPYREAVKLHAESQHKLLFDQLKHYPEHDPLQVLHRGATAFYDDCNSGEYAKAVRNKEMLLRRLSPDLPDDLVGDCLLFIGQGEIILRQFDDAIAHLSEASVRFSRIRHAVLAAKINKVVADYYTGEAHLRRGNSATAVEFFKGAARRLPGHGRDDLAAQAYLSLGEAQLRVGVFTAASSSIETVVSRFKSNMNNSTWGRYWRLKGDCHLALLRDAEGQKGPSKTSEQPSFHVARDLYEKALAMYTADGNMLGEANVHKCLGDIDTIGCDYQAALTHFQAAEDIYTSLGNKIGNANLLLSRANFYRLQNLVPDSLRCLREAIDSYRSVNALYGLSNAIADKVICLQTLPGLDAMLSSELHEALSELEQIAETTNNLHALDVLRMTSKMLNNSDKEKDNE